MNKKQSVKKFYTGMTIALPGMAEVPKKPKQSIVDFFDPYNVEHLKAYRVLEKTGFWPKEFLPEDDYKNMEWPLIWQAALTAKMTAAWLEQAEAGHIFGMPNFNQ
jgi:hypothetical protein